MVNKGKLIVFEGADCSGKTTALNALSSRILTTPFFRENFTGLVKTREPGGTGALVAEKIRALLFDDQNAIMEKETEALLFAASRIEHVKKLIIPSIAANKLVLSDRFIYSSIIYQGLISALGTEQVLQINHFTTTLIQPDLVFLMVTDAAIRKQRLLQRHQDQEDNWMDHFFNHNDQVQTAYTEYFRDSNTSNLFLLDGNLPVEIIVNNAIATIKQKIC